MSYANQDTWAPSSWDLPLPCLQVAPKLFFLDRSETRQAIDCSLSCGSLYPREAGKCASLGRPFPYPLSKRISCLPLLDTTLASLSFGASWIPARFKQVPALLQEERLVFTTTTTPEIPSFWVESLYITSVCPWTTTVRCRNGRCPWVWLGPLVLDSWGTLHPCPSGQG